MPNEPSDVEIVTEPKIESRFGYQGPSQRLSPALVRALVFATFLSLTVILVLKSPERPVLKSSQGIRTPDSGQLGSQSNSLTIDNYSLEKENDSMKEKSKQKTKVVIVKLPGLQKIDRTTPGHIPPGSEIRARLLTGASNGLVRAEALEDLKIRGENYVYQGDILLGQGQSTNERLYIRFTQLIHARGEVETIQAQVADGEDKTAGLKGSKFARYAVRYGAAVGLNFIGGMTEGMQDRTVVGQQVVTTPNARNALLNGASRATIEMANDQMNSLRNQPPPITIDVGQEILIIFEANQ